MTPATTVDEELDPLVVEAADWLVRLMSGEATEADASALEAWRMQSPDHEAAFRELAGLRATTVALRQTRRTQRRRDIMMGAVALTATGSGAYGLVTPPYGLWPSLAELTAERRTSANERMAFSPIAGVRVEMNSRTSLSSVDRGAGVSLVQGELFVAVDHPSRPFLVEAGTQRLGATNARFNVRWLNRELSVACVSGAVLCDQAGRRTTLEAGEELVRDRSGRSSLRKTDPAIATAWREGLLIFKGTPLAEVIAQINLYRPGQVILANAEVGRRPVVGVFHTGQIENAIAEIQQLLDLPLRRLPGGVVLIG